MLWTYANSKSEAGRGAHSTISILSLEQVDLQATLEKDDHSCPLPDRSATILLQTAKRTRTHCSVPEEEERSQSKYTLVGLGVISC
jgi:hypothetical protein